MSGVRLTRVGTGGEKDTSVLVNPARFLWAEDRPRSSRNDVGFPGLAGQATAAQAKRMTILVFAGTTLNLSVTESVDEVDRLMFGGRPEVQANIPKDIPKVGTKETRADA